MPHASQQILVMPETIEGTTPAFSAPAAVYAYDVDHTHDADLIELSPVGNTMSKPIALLGGRRTQITYGVDLKPGGNGGTSHPVAPEFDSSYRACGVRRWQLYEVNIGAIASGPIVDFAAYTAATSGSVGFIMGDYATSVPKVCYWPTNGVPIANAEVVTVGAASFTSSSVSTAHGFIYAPTSRVWASANRGAWTGTPSVGEIVKGAPSGGIGRLLDRGIPLGGASAIMVEPIPGFPMLANADVITAQASGATATLSSGAAVVENYSVSQLFNIDGMGFLSYGCRGNAKFDWKTGGVCRLEFAFQGYELAVLDTPMLSGTSYDTSMPPRLVSASGSIDAATLACAGLSMDLQNAFSAIPDWNTPEGARVTRVVNRNPTGQLDFDLVPVAAYDFWSKWRAGTTANLRLRLGTAQNLPFGNIGGALWIDAPRVQYRKPKVGNRDGNANVVIDVGYTRNTDDGDNELFIRCL